MTTAPEPQPISSNEHVFAFPHGHSDVASSVAWSPDGSRIVSGGDDDIIRMWDLIEGMQTGTVWSGQSGAIESVAWSPDGSRMVSGGADGSVRLWTAGSGEATLQFSGHRGSAWSVAWSPDGSRVVSGGDDDILRLWDVVSGEQVREWSGHSGSVWSVAWSPDGSRVVSGGADGTVRLWDVVSGEQVREWSGHSGWVRSVAWSPDGSQVVSGGDDDTVRLWDVTTGLQIREWPGHSGCVSSVAWSPDGSRVVSGGADGSVRLWDVHTEDQSKQAWSGHSGSVWTVAWSPDGSRVVSGGADGSVRLWDARTGNQISVWSGHGGPVRSIGWSPDSSQIVSGGTDETVRLWDVGMREQVGQDWIGHSGSVFSVAWSPDGTRVVSGGADGAVRLWDPDTGEQLAIGEKPEVSWSVRNRSVRSLAWSPDGTQVISGGDDSSVRLWDVVSGIQLDSEWSGHSGSVFSVAWSPDGSRVVSGGDGGSVRLWRVSTGRQVEVEWSGHSGSVFSVAWSPDGTQVVSGGADGSVRLWGVSSRRQAGIEWSGHSGSVFSVAWHPDCTRILVAGQLLPISLLQCPEAFAGELRPQLASHTKISSDSITVADDLGRVLIAEHIAQTVKQLVESSHSRLRDDTSDRSATTVISLDGAWGTGKTWLAHRATELMTGQLTQPIVVDFDCWRESKVSPEWWSLANAIRSTVVAERSWPSKVVFTCSSLLTRWWSSPITKFAGIGFVIALFTGLLTANLGSLTKWWSIVAAVIVTLVATGRALFWSAPFFGKMHLRTDDNPMADIARMVYHVRAWSSLTGTNHRRDDSLLTLILGTCVLHFAFVLKQNGYQPPFLPIYQHLDQPWVWSVSAGLFFGSVTGSAFRAVTASKPSNRSLGWQSIYFMAFGLSAAFYTRWVIEPFVSRIPLSMYWSLAAIAAIVLTTIIGHYQWSEKQRKKLPRRPIVLILDELDRCETQSVVRYLETVHTIIRPAQHDDTILPSSQPAPLIVLALADGSWVREAFTTHYTDFAAGNDPTKELGADFIQKLFDHTILVPELSAAQVQRMISSTTKLDNRAPKSARSRQNQPVKDTSVQLHRPIYAAQLEPLRSDFGVTTELSSARDPLSDEALETQRAVLKKRADIKQVQQSEQHLLTQYVEFMPANPRMIRRTVNAWAMLQMLQLHLGHKHDEETLVRSALFLTRFPSLTDWLRTTQTPPYITNDGKVRIPDWPQPLPEIALHFGRADVLHVLHWSNPRGSQRYLQPRTLGECFGVVYAPKVSDDISVPDSIDITDRAPKQEDNPVSPGNTSPH